MATPSAPCGAIEAPVCALAIVPSLASSTINLAKADPACDLDYLAHEGRDADPELVMSNFVRIRRDQRVGRLQESELMNRSYLRPFVAEFVGTFALVFIGARRGRWWMSAKGGAPGADGIAFAHARSSRSWSRP